MVKKMYPDNQEESKELVSNKLKKEKPVNVRKTGRN